MDSVLEEQRGLHEERDRLVDTMTREWLVEKKTHKERINSDHRIKLLLDRYLECSRKLQTRYTDESGERDREIRALGGPNEFAEFYARLKTLKENHKRTTAETTVAPLSMEFHELNALIENPNRVETNMVTFTDEEGYGRFLDLNAHYLQYVNLKGVKRVDYISWLNQFDKLYDIPKETKKTGAYRQYVSDMSDYLFSFLQRTRPLERAAIMKDFKVQWANGKFPGWAKEKEAHGALKHSSAHLDLSPYTSASELQALGLERLKSALMALGLKCGGTLQERAARLYATKGKRMEELDPSLFTGKKESTGGADAAAEKQKDALRRHDIAALEAMIYHMVEALQEERHATHENVTRKQARTVGELEEEEEEEQAAEAAAAQVVSDDEDNDVPYNPKNVPLDWNGKPIPYWLFKLHGLNINYPCEICGNQVYKGPKAFQMHFSEWRHSHGMRCLGIPNTAHFANITKISDAVELWKKISVQKEHQRFKPELEEEFEDSAGNVVTRKTFEDLKRQGLL